METELLAQIVEEVSVVATNNVGRKKPLKVPRPDHVKAARKRPRRQLEPTADQQTAGSNVVDMAGYRQAVGVLSGSRRRVVK